MIQPEALFAHFHFSPRATVDGLVTRFAALPHRIVRFIVTGMKGTTPGGRADLERRLRSFKKTRFVSFDDERGISTEVVVSRSPDEEPGLDVWISAHGDAMTEKLIVEWIDLARNITTMKEFLYARVGRDPSSMTSFVPAPPLARAHYFVTTTDAEVEAAYEKPGVFWKAWKREKLSDGSYMCTRALDCFEEHAWLAYTFESTMAMIRAARPNLTKYSPPYWEEEFAAWWKYGDILEERAGYPALAPIGYNSDDDCYDMAGFVTRTPISKGGKEPRHLLLKELYDLRRIARGKKLPDGKPIKALRVTFPEKWMAEQEKRPLLDAGAEVFYGKGRSVT